MNVKIGDLILWNSGFIDKIISIDGNRLSIQIMIDQYAKIFNGHPLDYIEIDLIDLSGEHCKVIKDIDYFTLVMEQ